MSDSVHGRFAVSVRLEGTYCLDFPASYPGGPARYIDDLAGYAVDTFASHLFAGRIDRQTVRVTQELERSPIRGAIA